MSVRVVRGDIFLTRAQAIAIGIDAAGRLGTSALYTALHDRCPVFISECRKHGRAGTLTPGTVWIWHEGVPWVAGLVVRETPQGATRLRYVEAAMLNLYRNREQEGLLSLAVMRLGDESEWPSVRRIVEAYLGQLELPALIYEEHLPGIAAEALIPD
jgi:O-acetyl-ADP-ribose deacetylase (regulator of RNase III)